jgi:hypothetical protein
VVAGVGLIPGIGAALFPTPFVGDTPWDIFIMIHISYYFPHFLGINHKCIESY